VTSRIAIASTDFVAADRISVDAMGVDPTWGGYLGYCWDAGPGHLRGGVTVLSVRKEYKLHPRISRQLEWRGPLPKA